MRITVGGVACGLAAALGFGGVATAQDAVQWRVEDGGNGHWYRLVTEALTWSSARDRAVALGGHLATLTSEGEALFVVPYGVANAWLGGSAPPNQGCVAAAWTWVTGEEWSYTYWAWGEPGNCSETGLAFAGWGGYSGRWNNQHLGVEPTAFFMEYSADCNGDGIVDYGQILDGTLIDKNGNGIPDCCEFGFPCFPDPCPGDLNDDGIVNGADISIMLGFWGLNGKPVDADINGDGLVDGADLAMLLSSWGKCP